MDIWCKRDDLFIKAGGGSKARMLQYILYPFVSENIKVLITAGGPCSNFNRATALMCAELGIRVKPVSYTDTFLEYETSLNHFITDLAGVEFGLYSVDGKLIASKLTDSNGKITWQDVAAGDYYVQEITPLPGYKLDTTKYNVTVKANQSEVIDYLVEGTDGKKGTIINTSTMGRLVIKKVDDDTNKGLEGAVFKISKVNDGTFVPIELTTNKQGIAVSDLLPASKDGSEYLITEIKAPDGYSLDEKYHQI